MSVSGLSLITYLVDIPSFAPVVGAMVGLGVGIDYALFVVTRHREHLAAGLGVAESAGRAVATAGQSVVFAGGVVVIAILGLAVAGIPFMTAAGIAISVVVGTMVVAAITLLPALLGLAGHRINGLRSGRRQRQQSHVADRTLAAVGPSCDGARVASTRSAPRSCCSPSPHPPCHFAWASRTKATLPQSRTERQAYDLLADGFGPGANGPLVIAVDVSGRPRRARAAGRSGRAPTRASPSVAPTELSADGAGGHPGRHPVHCAAGCSDARRPSSGSAPRSSLRCSVDSTAAAHVGGQTATWADLGGRVRRPAAPGSSPPSCCSRSCCSRSCSARCWCR